MMTDTHEGQGLNQCALNDCVIAIILECGCVQLLNIQCILEKGVYLYIDASTMQSYQFVCPYL